MRRALTLLLSTVASLCFSFSSASGQSGTFPVSYSAGWNMVGGPEGSVFSAASTVYGYSPKGYELLADRTSKLCVGYWAYFSDPTAVSLPAAAGPNQTCPLFPGFSLIGNPFAGKALLPAGTVAYLWNPDRGAYDNVSAIPPGRSVWIFAASGGSIELTYAPETARPAVTLTIDNGVAGQSEFTVHVGDSIRLLIPATVPSVVTADSTHLHLDTSGLSGPLSCVGNNCALSLLNQVWTWHTVESGIAVISVHPICPAEAENCATTRRISITVLP